MLNVLCNFCVFFVNSLLIFGNIHTMFKISY